MRVLLIKTSSLGDVIHTLPALTDAARAIPGIRFDWVVEEAFAEIPAWHPAVERVIPVAIRRWRKHLLATWRSGEWAACKRMLGDAGYDLAIDAQGLLKSALLCRHVVAPVVGLDRRSAREPLASLFYDRVVSVPRNQHAVERLRQLFAAALGYGVPEMPGDCGIDRSRFGGEGEVAPYLVFLHGTTWPTKYWPEAHWRSLAQRASEAGYRVHLPWGSEVERARAERIAEGIAGVRVLERMNLAGISRVLAGARGAVAVDTGLGHLAAALATPCVSLFGPTHTGLTGAYGPSQRHLEAALGCSPCLQERCRIAPEPAAVHWPPCMDALDPDRVWGALQERMAVLPGGPG